MFVGLNFARKFAGIAILALGLAGCDEEAIQNAAIQAVAVNASTSLDAGTSTQIAQNALPDVLRGKRQSRYTAIEKRMQQIVNNIANVNGIKNYNWEVYLIADKAVNASTIGGGIIFVNEGMLSLTPNESDIAMILAHEMAHVTANDNVRSARANANINLGAAILGSALNNSKHANNPWAQTLANLAVGAAAGQTSQSFERQADQLGFVYYVKAGYMPIAAPAVFDRLARRTGNDGSIRSFLSTHPQPVERKKLLEELIARQPNSRSGRQNTTAWENAIRPYLASLEDNG